MTFVRWGGLAVLGAALLVLACGGGGGGGMGPCTPGVATHLVKTSGDPAAWYLDNPLPTPLSVTARDANNCPVPGVVVNWAVASGGGGVNPGQSTTGTAGVATTTDSIGSTSPQKVSASFTGLQTPDTFTVSASTPPTSAAVSVSDNVFSPGSAVIQSGGTVTWTWAGRNIHNLTFTGGPAPQPADQGNQVTGTAQRTLTTVGKYSYTCTNHAGMNGTVRVVH